MRDSRRAPAALGSLAALACVACCALPALLAAGLVSGTAWATTRDWLPAIAVTLAAAAAATWWATHRRRTRCSTCPTGCACT